MAISKSGSVGRYDRPVITELKPEVIRFKMEENDLKEMTTCLNRLEVTAGVDIAQPGAYTIRNHSFETREPGAFTIRNYNFSTKKPGAFAIRNYRFASR